MARSGDMQFGGCLLSDYELRITRRCLVDDLQIADGSSFEEAAGHPIVHALVAKRSDNPVGPKTVGPAAGSNTLYHLGTGHVHRGATWFDPEHKIVWLCAYGKHRSGTPDDAFQLFRQLIDSEAIYPTEEDYMRVTYDRESRFFALASDQADAIRQTAIEEPGQLFETLLGHPLGRCVSLRILAADVAGDICELTIAFSPAGMNSREIASVVEAFHPAAGWEPTDSIGGDPISFGFWFYGQV